MRPCGVTLWRELDGIGTSSSQVFWPLEHGDSRDWKRSGVQLLRDYTYRHEAIDGLTVPGLAMAHGIVVKSLRCSERTKSDRIRVVTSELVRKDFKAFDIKFSEAHVALEFTRAVGVPAVWRVSIGPVMDPSKRKRKLEAGGALAELLKMARPKKEQKIDPTVKACKAQETPNIWW